MRSRRLSSLAAVVVLTLTLVWFWRDRAPNLPSEPHQPVDASDHLPSDIIQLTPVSVKEHLAHQQDVVQLLLFDDRMEPATINVKAGDQVKLHVINRGARPHNLVLPDFHLVGRELAQGEENYVEFTATEAGEFPLYAENAGEVELTGRLIVEP